jgi:Flp pilus assembly pilin Flp
MSENIKSEEFRISGEEVITKIKELLHEGNVRRIILKDEKGVTLIEVPLTIGVIGAVLLPVWAAIGTIAGMAAKLTLVVERTEPKEE